ncbi:spermidine/putrescine ABC transporter ATP-binding protein [Anaerobranca gottschalkii]|uniref:Spermidine/putrescine import ATP-binding protein PotA n=1 Tax=Anaerobranca gottschalkii DSM 13577 TaxID=1120990 RepID=A0A1I0BXE9_9FIRM|nr:spermidine/putrescine ABC transporter ATP-binding protein [Anaerobranca gottschalkii]SET11763.1 spermidine/putrescine transport system ATP-binding protein [Anaerobranca gottschalkii DSM 13577]
MKDSLINLVNINKSYGEHTVIENLNLYIKENEFLTLLGPSGCGKTTILRMIGGFENPTKGDIYFLNERINDVPPYKRQINTVFQKYALFPHLNVFENIAFGLKIKKLPQKTIEEKVKQMLAIVGLEGLEKRDVESLSGGQQQRVAIARSLVNEPKVLLLDEPLGALDLKLRKEMQIELKNMQKQLGITFVYVTHDQEEALTMSDTIVVMDKGKIQQIGTPTDIYNEPKNAFVADFIGESNIIDGIMYNDYDVSFCNYRFKCIDKGFKEQEPVDVVVRPEDIQIVKEGEGMLQGVVQSVIFKGVHYEMLVDCNGYSWKIHSTDMVPVGNRVGINIGPEAIHIMRKTT